ncbi:unnamed protein product, partial [marine sediment metagenome]
GEFAKVDDIYLMNSSLSICEFRCFIITSEAIENYRVLYTHIVRVTQFAILLDRLGNECLCI